MFNDLTKTESMLLQHSLRFNTVIFAVILGLLGGGLLWSSTIVLLIKGGENLGTHLSLLSVFFPGYSVTWPGAWIGLLWGFVFGAVTGAVLYFSYGGVLRDRIANTVMENPGKVDLIPPVMRLSGVALGTGLGAVLALQLLVTTNWLVIRGTAAYSSNAALLAHYLPGYTVSFVGSLIGAAELFVLALVSACLVSLVYNAIAAKRSKGA
jgi:hypothetical protein